MRKKKHGWGGWLLRHSCEGPPYLWAFREMHYGSAETCGRCRSLRNDGVEFYQGSNRPSVAAIFAGIIVILIILVVVLALAGVRP